MIDALLPAAQKMIHGRAGRYACRVCFCALALMAVLLLLCSSAGAATVQHHRLDNGVRVVLAPHRGASVVAMQAWLGVGAADDTIAGSGTAHVVEHMLFKGTARRGVGELARVIEQAGGDLDAWTSFDETVYHLVLPSRRFDIGLDVLADALAHSRFAADELERERQVILEELRHRDEDPQQAAAQALLAMAYAHQPYGHPILGHREHVQRLRRSQLLQFVRAWYVGRNLTFVAAGDFEPGWALERVRLALAAIPDAALPRRVVSRVRSDGPRHRVARRDVGQSYVAMAVPTAAVAHEDQPALEVLASFLNRGGSSRLVRRVERDGDLVHAMEVSAHALRHAGLFVITAIVQPAALESAIRSVAAELAAVAEQPMPTDALHRARRAVEARAAFAAETAQGVARTHGFWATMIGDPGHQRHYLATAAAVDASQLRRVAARYFDARRLLVAAIVPPHGRASSIRTGTAWNHPPGFDGGASLNAQPLAETTTNEERAAAAHAPSQEREARQQSFGREQTRGRHRGAVVGAPGTAGVRVASKPDVVRAVLPNGVRVLIKADAGAPLVAMRALWPGGVRLERETNSGVTRLLAALLPRGCGQLGAKAFAKRVDDMAGSIVGIAGRDSFGLRAEWLARDWREGLELLADCLTTPALPSRELTRERRRALNELRARGRNPSYAAFRALHETLFRSHPYRFDPLGRPEALASISRDDLLDLYQHRYPLSAMTIAIVGDVEPGEVLRELRERFADAPRRRASKPEVAGETFDGRSDAERQVFRFLDRQQAHLVVGFPGTTLASPDRAALEILATVLGGQGGRLFLELRERQALAYRISAQSVEGVDRGVIAFYLACSPSKLPAAVRGLRVELQRVVDEGIDPEELERAVEYLVGVHEIALQRRAAVAAAMAFHEAHGLGWDAYRRYAAELAAVTVAQVQQVARKYLDWKLAVTSTVMPPTLTPGAGRRASPRRPVP